jgi:UDP-3-O-[3-hydroxymyristoyl] N-acetylglucosamine deacetylase
MSIKQKTIKENISFEGIGVHSGAPVTMTLMPAGPDHGIQFKRLDQNESHPIPALWSYVTDTTLCTRLTHKNTSVATVEHLMAALAALQIDNVLVQINGEEVPIMDGSSDIFFNKIEKAGKKSQHLMRRYIMVEKPVKVSNGESWAQIKPHYAPTFSVRYLYKNKVNNIVETYDTGDIVSTFKADLAPARTFGFLEEVEFLKSKGLIKGGSLDNAVVFDKGVPLNEGGLRFENECARHKALDVLGDFYLAGLPIIGRFEGYASGHRMNNQLLSTLLHDRSAWSITTLSSDGDSLSTSSQYGT